MTIFEKYPQFSKGRLTILQGAISKLYDAGKTAEEIVKLTELPEDLVIDMVAIKEKAIKNQKGTNN